MSDGFEFRAGPGEGATRGEVAERCGDRGVMGAGLRGKEGGGWSAALNTPHPTPHREMRVSGFGFRDAGFRFSGFGFRVSRFGMRNAGFGFRVWDFGFRVLGFRFRVLG